jgi:hypothetical protein
MAECKTGCVSQGARVRSIVLSPACLGPVLSRPVPSRPVLSRLLQQAGKGCPVFREVSDMAIVSSKYDVILSSADFWTLMPCTIQSATFRRNVLPLSCSL